MIGKYRVEPYNISILRKAVLLMDKLYWFTNDDGDKVMKDFYGTEQEATYFAEEQAKILGEDITINCDSDIAGVVYAE